MNPWEAVLVTLGWLVLGVVLIVAAIIWAAMIFGVATWIKKWFSPKKTNSENFYREANRVATEGYSHDTLLAPDLIKAFNAGAHWGREHTTKKPARRVDRDPMI